MPEVKARVLGPDDDVKHGDIFHHAHGDNFILTGESDSNGDIEVVEGEWFSRSDGYIVRFVVIPDLD